jgi:death-on-curing protein
MVRLLDLGEAIQLHCDQVNRYGGQAGIRHTGALRGAVGQRDHGTDLFKTAAGYTLDFATTRPFPDANARAGVLAALVFLDLNGITIEATDDEIVELVGQVRARKLAFKPLAEFLRSHSGKPSASSPAPDLDAPAGPSSEPTKERKTSASEMADAFREAEDDGA